MRALATALSVVALAVPAVAGEPDLTAAKAFVTALYAAYQREPGPDYTGRQASRVFTPDLISLMRRSAATAPKGDVPPLDGDPICDCQDYEIRDIAVSVVADGPAGAHATASFRNAGEPTTIRLDLVRLRTGWRVADVHSPSTPSLVAFLTDSLKPPPR